MTKAVVILNALKAKRILKEICETYNISYKYCHSLTKGNKNPSWDIMNKFRFMIPTDFWFQTATKSFVDEVVESFKKEQKEIQEKNQESTEQ